MPYTREHIRLSLPPDRKLGSERILILAPTGKDAELASRVLSQAGLETQICSHLAALGQLVVRDSETSKAFEVGALLLADEALVHDSASELVRLLGEQPPWSDIPIVILTSGDEATQATLRALDIFGSSGNVTLLERPLKAVTLISALHVALRSRRRQYMMRALFEELHRNTDSLLDQKMQLELARAEAESANHMKDQFLATLSHELRTPLNAILGWGQILRDDLQTRAQQPELETFVQGLEVIERNARVQAQLIEDLLDVSRIISGKLKIETVPVDLRHVVEATLESTRPQAEARKITLITHFPKRNPIVLGDFARLQQIVLNLLSNALKFTPEGGNIAITLSETPNEIRLSVRDSGQGISAEFLPHVFERFRQADASSTRQHGGLGLGLSIVRQLTHYHNGSIAVHSDGLGTGAVFEIVLPVPDKTAIANRITHRPNDAIARTSASDLSGIRIIVVDNEADARELIQRMLSEANAQVETAGSVDEAMLAIERSKPDILISDIGMPLKDGYDLIREIRNGPDGIRSIPVVALTAFAGVEDRTRAAESGFQAHLAKPVDANELRATVAKLATRTHS